jgi:probable addiction module antidote protein
MPKRTANYRDGLLEDLRDPQEAADYVQAALCESNESFLRALRDVAEAKQMARVAKEAGVAREALYRMLSETGNPTLSSLSSILTSVGLEIEVKPIQRSGVVGSPHSTIMQLDQPASISYSLPVDITQVRTTQAMPYTAATLGTAQFWESSGNTSRAVSGELSGGVTANLIQVLMTPHSIASIPKPHQLPGPKQRPPI